MHIAIYGRVIDAQWKAKLCRVLASLTASGACLVYFEPFYFYLQHHLGCGLLPAPTFNHETGLPADCTLLLNLGGDGTFLESLLFLKKKNIPVAGINFGRLGFLAGETDSYEACVAQLLKEDYLVEERSLLEVSSAALPKKFFPYALNEFSLQRKSPAMISITVSLKEGALPAYWADGLIVATPTGSTAYSLSVGGPIVFPNADVFIVEPIAPHNLNVRPIVLPDTEELSVLVESRVEKAIMTLDNRSISIPSGTEVKVKKAPFMLQYVSLPEQHFLFALHEKLQWGFDKRNIKKT